MARTSLQILLIILLLPAGSALSFNIDLEALTDHSVKDTQYMEEVEKVQNVNASIENVGSIGCTYRMRADFQKGKDTFQRYSSPNPLWQGDSQRLGINYIPLNYTGQVQTNLSLEYCGQKKKIDSFNFTVTENTTVNSSIDSRTVSSDDEKAEVWVEGDKLIPEEEPNYWKTSSTEIENGTAQIEYDAPIFDQKEEITYTVLEDGEITGTTTVSLKPEPTIKQKILDRKLDIITGILAISVLINILLVLKQKGVLAKIRSIEYELPGIKKQEK